LDLYDTIIHELEKAPGVTLFIHKSPDGDALGSALALSMALESQAKDTLIYCWDEVPYFYRFLPRWERITKVRRQGDVSFYPVSVGIDASDLDRLPFLWERPPGLVINIDHHPTNARWGDLNLVEPQASATGEIIFRLLERWEVPITLDMATCLYTAIFTDTGGYRFANTTALSLLYGNCLVEMGVSPYHVATHVYESYSPGRMRLLGLALNTLTLVCEGRLAWVVVTRAMMGETGTGPEDTEEFVNFPKSIKGVEVALLFRETESGVKVSFRSKGRVDVAVVASSLGGGGHKAAAGCDLPCSTMEAVERVVPLVEEALACSTFSTDS
jgi:phosphoesterase RecJ-like protein